VRELNRLERVLESVRVALNALADAAPEWLRAVVPEAWVERYGYRPDAWRLPQKAPEREALLETVGADGYALLEAVWRTGPEAARALEEVETLRVVWVQNFHLVEGEGRPRGPKDLPPASRHIDTPHDVEARHGAKNATRWTGYKVHVTESCEPGRPHVVTDVATRPALEGDNDALPGIHERLERVGLLPSQHLVDGSYIEGKGLVESRARYGVELYGPAPGNRGWQAGAASGHAISNFALDWERERAVCPQGKPSSSWKAGRDGAGDELIHIQFAKTDCGPCPARAQCTKSKAGRRTLNVRPRERHEALEAARAREREEAFTTAYKKRAGIEGTLSAGVRAFELRRSRYIGSAKLHLQHLATAAAINLVRAWAWLEGDRPEGTRRSAFLRLMVPIAA
jgi:transposase